MCTARRGRPTIEFPLLQSPTIARVALSGEVPPAGRCCPDELVQNAHSIGEMLSPVWVIQGIQSYSSPTIWGMDKPAFTHIDGNMTDIGSEGIEKYQIPWSQFTSAQVACFHSAHFRSGSRQLDARYGTEHIINQAATIETAARGITTPLIGCTDQTNGAKQYGVGCYGGGTAGFRSWRRCAGAGGEYQRRE